MTSTENHVRNTLDVASIEKTALAWARSSSTNASWSVHSKVSET
jgi:hypothetical protein